MPAVETTREAIVRAMFLDLLNELDISHSDRQQGCGSPGASSPLDVARLTSKVHADDANGCVTDTQREADVPINLGAFRSDTPVGLQLERLISEGLQRGRCAVGCPSAAY